MEGRNRKLNYFKDKMFDLLNDADDMGIKDIETNDRKGIFRVTLQEGGTFEVECRQAIS